MTPRQKQMLLAALLVAWVGVAWIVWQGPGSAPVAAPAAGAPAGEEALPAGPELRVRLDRIDAGIAATPARDLFGLPPAPVAPAAGDGTPASAAPAAVGPAPAVPGAGLRYVGFVRIGDRQVAVLQEGTETWLGAAGERVGPGYRVLRITGELVEVEIDGTTRQLPLQMGGAGEETP